MSLEEQQTQQFDKEIKKCNAEIKEQINKIIKHNGSFTCMSKEVSIIIFFFFNFKKFKIFLRLFLLN